MANSNSSPTSPTSPSSPPSPSSPTSPSSPKSHHIHQSHPAPEVERPCQCLQGEYWQGRSTRGSSLSSKSNARQRSQGECCRAFQSISPPSPHHPITSINPIPPPRLNGLASVCKANTGKAVQLGDHPYHENQTPESVRKANALGRFNQSPGGSWLFT